MDGMKQMISFKKGENEMRDYAEKVRAKVENMLDDVDVEIVRTAKMNIGELTGVCIRKSDSYAAPTFYLEEIVNDEMSPTMCAGIIVNRYNENNVQMPVPELSYENIKDDLTARVVDIDMNESWLQDKVYRTIGCGLAVTVDINLSDEYRAAVTKSMAHSYNYDESEVIDKALTNSTQRPVLTPIELAMHGGKVNLFKEEDVEADGALILTNPSMLFGAVSIARNEILSKVRQILKDDFYVLPSSVHEVIIIPDRMDLDIESLKEMVVGANSTVVLQNDILSDSVYHYENERLVKVA